MKISQLIKQFNWRYLLVRILVNAIALAVTAFVVPRIEILEMPSLEASILNWLFLAIVLGILNAVVKPILQFLTAQFLFVTYGLTIILVNTLILVTLSWLFPTRFAVDNLFWAFVGGLVLGLLSSFLESLLGLTMPIVPDEPPDLRQRLEEQAHPVDWLAARSEDTSTGRLGVASEGSVMDTTSASIEVGPSYEELEQPLRPESSVVRPATLEVDEQPDSDGDLLSVAEEESKVQASDDAGSTGEAGSGRDYGDVPEHQTEEAKEDAS
jgi:putative membrane protein